MSSINQEKTVELVLHFVLIPTTGGNAKFHNLTFTVTDKLQSNSAAAFKIE